MKLLAVGIGALVVASLVMSKRSRPTEQPDRLGHLGELRTAAGYQ